MTNALFFKPLYYFALLLTLSFLVNLSNIQKMKKNNFNIS